MSNAYGIDLGTSYLKIYDNSSDTVLNISNTIAVIDGNQMYAYGDDAYSMYEKAPDTINVTFPIVSGVIADFDNMQTMLFEGLEPRTDYILITFGYSGLTRTTRLFRQGFQTRPAQ